MRISEHFVLSEFERSQTAARRGIKISIPVNSCEMDNCKRLAHQVLEPGREKFGPCFISSGYRPLQLNALIGGSKTSAHIEARAADAVFSQHDCADVARWYAHQVLIPFDQCIYEFGQWLHLSVAKESDPPRRQVLTAYKEKTLFGYKTRYAVGVKPELVAMGEESLLRQWWRKLSGSWVRVDDCQLTEA